jgi:hypothetical protein
MQLAASKSINDPDRDKIEGMVKKIILISSMM